jgi:hypothetical protein
MIDESDPIVRTAERLCETLHRIGDALVAVDAATLLETEETLGQLLTALAAGHPVQDKPLLEATVRRASLALLRCRRLGASFSAVAGTRLRMRTGVETYGKDGAYVEHAVSGSAVKVMT